MKKLYIIILFIYFSEARAQNAYYPMLDSINKWYFGWEAFGVGPEVPCSYPFFATDGNLTANSDTVINSLTYKKVTTSFCTFGFLREDTASRKIYFKENNSNAEKLIYDFSMQIGDSIEISFYQNSGFGYWQDGFYRLDSIDSINTAAGYRRQFHLNCNVPNGHTLSWVEGVGNLCNPIYTHCDIGYGLFEFAIYCPVFPHTKGGDFVTCFEHAQKVYVDSCGISASQSGTPGFTFVDSCNYYFFTGNVAEINKFSLTISPNPFHDLTEFRIDNYDYSKVQLKLYDGLGKLVRENSFESASLIIDRKQLPAGIYFYRLTGNEKHASGKLVVN